MFVERRSAGRSHYTLDTIAGEVLTTHQRPTLRNYVPDSTVGAPCNRPSRGTVTRRPKSVESRVARERHSVGQYFRRFRGFRIYSPRAPAGQPSERGVGRRGLARRAQPILWRDAAAARGPGVRAKGERRASEGRARPGAKDHQRRWQVDRCPGLVCGLAPRAVKRGNVSVCVSMCQCESVSVSVQACLCQSSPGSRGRPTGTQA